MTPQPTTMGTRSAVLPCRLCGCEHPARAVFCGRYGRPCRSLSVLRILGAILFFLACLPILMTIFVITIVCVVLLVDNLYRELAIPLIVFTSALLLLVLCFGCAVSCLSRRGRLSAGYMSLVGILATALAAAILYQPLFSRHLPIDEQLLGKWEYEGWEEGALDENGDVGILNDTFYFESTGYGVRTSRMGDGTCISTPFAWTPGRAFGGRTTLVINLPGKQQPWQVEVGEGELLVTAREDGSERTYYRNEADW